MPGYITTLRNTRLDALITALGANGLLRIYDGTRPATGGTATTKLAELALSATAAPGASGGVSTFGTITQDSSADASGTATWARLCTSAGVAVADLSAGGPGSGMELILTTASIVAGQPVQVTSCVLTEGNP